jgi:hypothetical protein
VAVQIFETLCGGKNLKSFGSHKKSRLDVWSIEPKFMPNFHSLSKSCGNPTKNPGNAPRKSDDAKGTPLESLLADRDHARSGGQEILSDKF